MNIARAKHFLKAQTTRLTLSYLAIIMLMSISFSFVFYRASSQELGRQIPPPGKAYQVRMNERLDVDVEFKEFLQERIDEGRRNLLTRLVMLNLLTLVAGTGVSYILARATLEPIERAMEAQARFASDASHELRTPLTIIQAENEVALRSPKLSLDRAKEVLASNLEEVTRLKGLSEGLLRLATDTKLELVPVWLDDVAGAALDAIVKSAQAKQITIEDSTPHVQVLADAQAFTQALTALLDNAVKYSPEGTTVKLYGGTEDNVAVIHITDQGEGIAKTDLPHIFDRFYRADTSRSKKTGGYGLGLAIVKNIVEEHGGNVGVASEPGKGTTFSLRINLSE